MTNIVSDKAIKEIIARGINIIEPFNEIAIRPASIDLRLGNTLYEYKFDQYVLGEAIDEKDVIKREFETHSLKNGETAFVGILEKISIPDNMIGIIFSRRSITRLGIHIVTTYMNSGYLGYMPLTITNHMGARNYAKTGLSCCATNLVVFRRFT